MSIETDYHLVQLANGAYSLHSTTHRETFHPVIGPAAEAQALYVEQLELPRRFAENQGDFVLWDVGLGAAANVLTVLKALRNHPGRLRIVSFDHSLQPLEAGIQHAEKLGYFDEYEITAKTLLNQGQVEFKNGLSTVLWQLHLGDFPTLLHSNDALTWPKPHAILFDAFSPAKNAAMWTLPLFQRLYQLLDPDRACAMPTYSRSTLLRVTLLLAGFRVGTGHATGEKEETTIAANQPTLIQSPLGQVWLKRASNSTSAEPLHQAQYCQLPLSDSSRQKLLCHPQFTGG